MPFPDLLSIGHVCHDWTPQGYIPGGAVTFSSLLAQKLGLSTAILTSFGTDYQFESLLDQTDIRNIPAHETTAFKNEYNNSNRQQYLLHRANDISKDQLPDQWINPSMVFIGPISNEVDHQFLDTFDNDTVIAVSPQGWMRRWNKNKHVYHKMLDDYSFLNKASFTFISEEDVNYNQNTIQYLASLLDVLVVTKGESGCDLFIKNTKFNIPAFKTTVVDTTGAGDIFATAFLIFYSRTKNYIQAAQYANIAASFCIEAKGTEGIPDQEKIDNRLSEYLK